MYFPSIFLIGLSDDRDINEIHFNWEALMKYVKDFKEGSNLHYYLTHFFLESSVTFSISISAFAQDDDVLPVQI